MTTVRDCSRNLARPRCATTVTPGRRNVAGAIGKTAGVLGFTLMPWQHEFNAVATELGPDGRFVYRQVVLEVMRQQGKTVDLLSMMMARALRPPGGWQIAYTAQTRLDGQHGMMGVWRPRIVAAKLRRLVKLSCGSGTEALMFTVLS